MTNQDLLTQTNDYSFTQNRELSWLKFNQRVLEEAKDDTVPLLEKVKFVSIFVSNLDEFFMIRCGSLYDLSLVDKKYRDNKTGLSAKEQLDKIYERTVSLYEEKDRIYGKITKQLRAYGIIRHSFDDLDALKRKYITQYFYENVSPLISPQIIDIRHPFPHMINKKIYIYTVLESKDNERFMGLIPIPKQLPDYIIFPGTQEYILTEELIYAFADKIFSNFKVIYATIAAVTRNADINLQNSPIDEDEDYRHYMKNILKKRTRLAPIRLEFFKYNNPKYDKYLRRKLDLHKNQVFVTNTPINMDYIYGLIDSIPGYIKNELTFPSFKSQKSVSLNTKKSIFKQLDKKDVLLFYPYESMNTFIAFLKEAANDPDVISIRITLYRVARSSQVIKYLIEAVENEKEVIVLIELRARFDEKNNIYNAELLEEAGCQLLYGFENYKVHSKVCCVTKKSKNKITHYTQIGTGNYNEKTAKLYTDYAYLTSNKQIGTDAIKFFKNMALSNLNGEYDKLLVAPTSLRNNIIHYIDGEIEKARNGEDNEIIMKMNSLTDRRIIDKLKEASQNGVHITMVIRGICCIIPGLDGVTSNIEIRSIVGRYLEHSRIYIFGKGGDRKIYISSADLMTRNTAKRVEVACPIEDSALRQRILEDIGAMLKDDVKGRRINSSGDYEYISKKPTFNSQEFFQERILQEISEHDLHEENKTLIERIIEHIRQLF